jgi:hydrogenase expression/formation protein HypC
VGYRTTGDDTRPAPRHGPEKDLEERDMCVGLSAKVIKVRDDGTAVVEATGARREVSADLLDDLEPGDYVMVHAGSAIARIDGDDEDETDSILGEYL